MAVSCEMLLHPELLSSEQLLYIIKERRLNIANLESMPRHELLDVFHNYCVPYGQRKYRDSGRGKMLNKARPASPEPVVQLNTINNTQNRKFTHTQTSDRIKPPPDLLSGHLKRIKLDIKSKPVPEVNVWKRKMSIDATTQVSDSPPPKKERKPITWP
ncbi:hypothetical protein ABMA27_002442 [Loxostege sticticalis]|uniref:Ashwin n=1 Tax=Loxostege sticticalis TaxID=481309 RepID=A0ABR3HTP1_LOXSC